MRQRIDESAPVVLGRGWQVPHKLADIVVTVSGLTVQEAGTTPIDAQAPSD